MKDMAFPVMFCHSVSEVVFDIFLKTTFFSKGWKKNSRYLIFEMIFLRDKLAENHKANGHKYPFS